MGADPCGCSSAWPSAPPWKLLLILDAAAEAVSGAGRAVVCGFVTGWSAPVWWECCSLLLEDSL